MAIASQRVPKGSERSAKKEAKGTKWNQRAIKMLSKCFSKSMLGNVHEKVRPKGAPGGLRELLLEPFWEQFSIKKKIKIIKQLFKIINKTFQTH